MEEGKRVSWVELYLDLVFVLAVAQIAHLIVAEPEMHSVWVALGLFFTLWWTWVGFAVLYNRHGADERRQRVLFLAASVPTGVAAVAIEPASTGDSTVFALSLAATRIVLAVAHGIQARGPADPADHTRLRALRRAVLASICGARAVPLRALGDRDLQRVARDAGRGPRGPAPGAARALVAGAQAQRPERGARRAPLRRALRPVPDHPARRGRGRGRAGLGRRPRRLGRRLVRARGGDDPRGRAVVAVLRLRGRAQPAACSNCRAAHRRWRARSSRSVTCCPRSRC